jgi:ATP-dependent Lhr-like helicase
MDLPSQVHRAFYGRFGELRPAQDAAIAPILNGLDTVVLAGTGSGKTEAVIAPLVARHLRGPLPAAVVYLSPTRALANDMAARLRPALSSLGLSVGVRHGEQDDLRSGRRPDVLITTPESLDVLLWRGGDDLVNSKAIVLDEAHLIYNTQRGLQTSVLIRRLEHRVDRLMQVCAMSATVSSATELWRFFRPGRTPIEVSGGEHRTIDLVINTGQSPRGLADRLTAVITDAKILLFVNSRAKCDELASTFRQTPALSRVVWAHHASLSKEARLATESEFAARRPGVCVSTSTLELGIDIGDIDLVALWDPPMGWSSFVQRIGRGNRRSHKCEVLGVVHDDREEAFWPALRFEALLHQLAAERLDSAPALPLFGAIVQQILVILERESGFVRRSQLMEAFDERTEVDRAVVDEILDELEEAGLVQSHPVTSQVAPGRALERLRALLLIWSNFPMRSRQIQLRSPLGPVASVPGQNMLRLQKGAVFALGRDHWEVTGGTGYDVTVRLTGDPVSTKIRYGGLPASMDPSLVDEARRYLSEDGSFSHVQRSGRSRLVDIGRVLGSALFDDQIPVARTPAGNLYATFAGRRMNRQLARWAGADPDLADEVFVVSREAIALDTLPIGVADLIQVAADFETDADLTIFQELLPKELLARELSAEFTLHPRHQSVLERLRSNRVSVVRYEDLRPLRVATGQR